MKKTLFGSLGEMIKGNALVIILGICVIAAGALSFYTVNDINNKLENQNIENPNPVPDIIEDEQAQDVQNNAENVPLKDKPVESAPQHLKKPPQKAQQKKLQPQSLFCP